MLSERQKKIVEMILKHPKGVNATNISKELSVSSRTIRNDIASINVCLMNNHCMINSSKRVGYFIVEDSVEKVKECITLMEAIDHKQIASTPMERKYYILGQLFHRESVSLYDIASELFVSEQTIYKDITSFQKSLKKLFHYDGLLLENGELCLKSDEVALRTLLYRIVKEEIYLSNKLVDIHLYQLVKDFIDVEEIYDIVDYMSGYCKTHNVNIPDQMLFVVSWMVLFTITRCEDKCYIKEHVHLQHNNEPLHAMLHTLLRDLHYTMEVEDMSLLQNYMETLGLFSNQNTSLLSTSNEVIVHEFVGQMKSKYNLDFESMPSLFENFKSHLEFAIKRLLMDYQLINPLLQEVKTTYAFAYEIAMLIVPIVHKKYNLYMKEDEISFLALYIQPFLKVQNTSIKVLIVFGTTQSFASFIETWIHQEFKERVQVMGNVSTYQLEEEIKNQNVDLIISNIALEKKLNIPVIEIQQLPYEADRVQIENFISRRAMLSQSASIFHKVFSKDRILIIEEDISYEEILKRSAALLENHHKIPDAPRFVEDIISREKVYPTHIENGCFMPHPLMNTASEDAIMMVIVKSNILKDTNPVCIMFVSAFEPKIDADLKYIYNLINMIATTPSLIQMLLEMKTPEEVMDYLERIIQIMKD
ncbi:BglG family transcription antiterminator [Amedibacillus sp. YH-ame10]